MYVLLRLHPSLPPSRHARCVPATHTNQTTIQPVSKIARHQHLVCEALHGRSQVALGRRPKAYHRLPFTVLVPAKRSYTFPL